MASTNDDGKRQFLVRMERGGAGTTAIVTAKAWAFAASPLLDTGPDLYLFDTDITKEMNEEIILEDDFLRAHMVAFFSGSAVISLEVLPE